MGEGADRPPGEARDWSPAAADPLPRLTGGTLLLFTRPPWGEASWIRDRSAPGRTQTPALRVGQLAGALTWRTPLPRPA